MKRKRIVAIILAFVLIFGCFASGLFSASAKTQQIILDTTITNTTDGVDDKNWYYFTPEQTGMYTFLSYNRILYAEAYLFIKDGKEYTQLAYSNISPNWEHYSQPNKYQFCISYQLEAGKTYYYAAGWDSERSSGEMTVKLIYEGSEEDVIDSIEISCNAELTWYTDGTWETDSNGEAYFSYNYSRILQNMVVKLNYKNGSSSSTELGGNTVDGYTIKFTHNQSTAHWYPREDEKYTGNYITVSILNKSAKYDVVINQDALFTVKVAVCDYVNEEAISGAAVSINGGEDIITDSNGIISFVASPGVYNAKISGNNIISRNIIIAVDVNREKNDHRGEPVGVVASDYVKDGIINAKDFGYILKNFTGSEKQAEENKFAGLINFAAKDYEELVL